MIYGYRAPDVGCRHRVSFVSCPLLSANRCLSQLLIHAEAICDLPMACEPATVEIINGGS